MLNFFTVSILSLLRTPSSHLLHHFRRVTSILGKKPSPWPSCVDLVTKFLSAQAQTFCLRASQLQPGPTLTPYSSLHLTPSPTSTLSTRTDALRGSWQRGKSSMNKAVVRDPWITRGNAILRASMTGITSGNDDRQPIAQQKILG